MFSHYRHRRSVAKSWSLRVASSLLVATGAQAAETAHTPFVLTAYSNGAGGASLLKGEYNTALTQIQGYKPHSALAASAKATNLCVAYAATKQLTQAKSACDAALKTAKNDKMYSSGFSPGTTDNAYIAIAYTNRAVVQMLARDEAAARADLLKAQVLAPKADFVARNLAAAATKASTIAQLELAPSR